MIHSPYGTLRRMNRQDLFGRTGKGIRHTGRGEGGDDFASSSSPASALLKFREMQGLFQYAHYLYFIKLRAFLAALQEAEKCRPFSNRLILRDLQSGVHFSVLYKKLRNAGRFPIASLSEIYKATCISRGLTRERKMRIISYTFDNQKLIKESAFLARAWTVEDTNPMTYRGNRCRCGKQLLCGPASQGYLEGLTHTDSYRNGTDSRNLLPL